MRPLFLGLGLLLLLAACADDMHTAANDPYPLPDMRMQNQFIVGNIHSSGGAAFRAH